jgi:hypothetical protein
MPRFAAGSRKTPHMQSSIDFRNFLVTEDRPRQKATPGEIPHSINAETAKPKQISTTLGTTLFVDPLAGPGTISEIRQRLEVKYAACLATGGANGFPLHVNRIKDSRLRALAGAGMTLNQWSAQDLVQSTGNLEGHASSVLIATLEDPRWGPDDFRLMGIIEAMEGMRSRAMKGGNAL